jgi:hypothetical protein
MYSEVLQCGTHFFYNMFPDDVTYRWLVITINMTHLLGVLIIQFGILLPPNMMKYYIVYLILILTTYILINNRCFMTELSNYVGGKNYNTLCIRLTHAKKILIGYLVVAVLFEVFPQYSLYTFLTKLSKKNI